MEKVIYITGGTKGIGYGIAKKLLEAGYKVAISGRKEEDAQKAAQNLGDETQIIGIGSSVANFQDEVSAIEKIKAHFGRLDVLVANAGVGLFDNVRDLSIEDWQTMIDTNLTGTFYSLKASVEDLIANKGYFFSIASLAGIHPMKHGSGYNASKFGVVGFSQATMLDLRAEGVKVTTICPGSVTSHFNNHTPDASADRWKIQPEDMGQMVVDLLAMNPNVLPSKIEVRPAQTADMLK